MAIEIEKKFLLHEALWARATKPEADYFKQGYLYSDSSKTIRVRVTNSSGYLTIKGKTSGISRPEYEYEIPKQEAEELLTQFAESALEKYRYRLTYASKIWEVDVFEGKNKGLLLAEIELQDENERFELPPWIGQEVTSDHRYNNSYLAKHPFSEWKS
jgi:adenylate cyclase